MLAGKSGNFAKSSGKFAFLRTLGLPYDYNSVMHYRLNAFSKGAKYGKTMELTRNFSGFVGQRTGFSRTDLAAINRYYECWDYYLGDDIPGAVPYDDFHARYIDPDENRNVSGALLAWIIRMKYGVNTL
nr:zinc metalloproteinase nas-14-like [Cherax quadricarinatus]